MLAFEDPELTLAEKRYLMVSNLYKVIPDDLEKAEQLAVRFLDGDSGNPEGKNGSTIRLYSFSKDSSLIYSAFKQTHDIDLSTTSLHWWTFLALFMDLGSETSFCSLIALRKRVKSGKASKEEKAMAREIKEVFDLPEVDNRTLAEKEMERAFLEKVKQGKRFNG